MIMPRSQLVEVKPFLVPVDAILFLGLAAGKHIFILASEPLAPFPFS